LDPLGAAPVRLPTWPQLRIRETLRSDYSWGMCGIGVKRTGRTIDPKKTGKWEPTAPVVPLRGKAKGQTLRIIADNQKVLKFTKERKNFPDATRGHSLQRRARAAKTTLMQILQKARAKIVIDERGKTEMNETVRFAGRLFYGKQRVIVFCDAGTLEESTQSGIWRALRAQAG